MTLARACWVATAAYGIHIGEEFALDWRGWVRRLSGVGVGWTAFWVGNGLAVAFGAFCASMAAGMPVIGLAYPALMVVNATFFHLAPYVWTRGKFSPGMITGITMFYPAAFWCYWSAWREGVLSAATAAESMLLGTVIMLATFAVIKWTSGRPAAR
jgi:hypothetical protein